MNCSIMLHFIWVFTVFKISPLGVSRIQRVNHYVFRNLVRVDDSGSSKTVMMSSLIWSFPVLLKSNELPDMVTLQTCWISFAPAFSFITVESLSLLYLLLYLELYVLGDHALISQGYFMQTKHLCVLIHIWTKGEVGAPLNRFKPSSKIFLLTVPRRRFFCGSFMLFLSCCFVMLS